jgi:hypothetical protein
MPYETIQQLFALAHDGARIAWLGGLPKAIAGRFDAEKEKKYHDLIPHSAFRTPHSNGDTAALDEIARETMTKAGLTFVRRSVGAGWVYFIGNRKPTNFDGWIQLARPAASVIIFDPMTGNSGVAAVEPTGSSGGARVRLQLFAGESVMLRVGAGNVVEGRPWVYWESPASAAGVQALGGPWQVRFKSGGPTLPADFQTAQLVSWTAFPDPGVEAFAGTAEYETTFDASAGVVGRMALDLGDVHQSARVRVNGRDYGTLITPPFRVVVDNLKPVGNQLEVEVTSVAANRIRDLDRRGVNWKIFKEINFVDINYVPFNAAHWPITDCGLLGPVTLTPIKGSPLNSD